MVIQTNIVEDDLARRADAETEIVVTKDGEAYELRVTERMGDTTDVYWRHADSVIGLREALMDRIRPHIQRGR